jgi:hypothetical protein
MWPFWDIILARIEGGKKITPAIALLLPFSFPFSSCFHPLPISQGRRIKKVIKEKRTEEYYLLTFPGIQKQNNMFAQVPLLCQLLLFFGCM